MSGDAWVWAARPVILSDWYFVVAGDAARIYSTAAAGYVATGNVGYAAWLAAGNAATAIASEARLYELLAYQYPAALGPLGPRYVPLATIRERVTSAGKWPTFCAALDSLPSDKRWHLLTLADGVASDDPDAAALLTAIGLSPAVILAA